MFWAKRSMETDMMVPILADSARDRTDCNRRAHHTILVVDDEASIRELMAAILRRAGYTVVLAANAHDAASMFEQQFNKIDLIITDVWMPGVDGTHLVEQLLSIHPRLKCILMSANTCPALNRNVPLLNKPFSLFQLLSGVAEAFKEV